MLSPPAPLEKPSIRTVTGKSNPPGPDYRIPPARRRRRQSHSVSARSSPARVSSASVLCHASGFASRQRLGSVSRQRFCVPPAVLSGCGVVLCSLLSAPRKGCVVCGPLALLRLHPLCPTGTCCSFSSLRSFSSLLIQFSCLLLNVFKLTSPSRLCAQILSVLR